MKDSLERSEDPRMARSIVFLDIDDVLCTNVPYSGFDVINALRGRQNDRDFVVSNAFTPAARRVLAEVNRIIGPLRFVMSSSWRLEFTRHQLEDILRRNDLAFVVDGFAEDAGWATPYLVGGTRTSEIRAWLDRYHRGEKFIVLDDEASGAELVAHAAVWGSASVGHVLMCELGVGLNEAHIPIIVRALSGAGTSTQGM